MSLDVIFCNRVKKDVTVAFIIIITLFPAIFCPCLNCKSPAKFGFPRFFSIFLHILPMLWSWLPCFFLWLPIPLFLGLQGPSYIDIAVTFMYQRFFFFFYSLSRSKSLFIFLPYFIFILWSDGTANTANIFFLLVNLRNSGLLAWIKGSVSITKF